MTFKQNPNKKARLEDMGKTALIKTVKTLQRRETAMLNKITKLERELEKPSIEVVELRSRLERIDADLVEHGQVLPPAVYRDMRAAASGTEPDFGGYPQKRKRSPTEDDVSNANDQANAAQLYPWELP